MFRGGGKVWARGARHRGQRGIERERERALDVSLVADYVSTCDKVETISTINESRINHENIVVVKVLISFAKKRIDTMSFLKFVARQWTPTVRSVVSTKFVQLNLLIEQTFVRGCRG